MSDVNKAILIGRLGNEPQTKSFEDGNESVSFSLATTAKYKNRSGELKEVTQWHNVRLKPFLNKLKQYLDKGKHVYVEGTIEYTQSADGTKYTNIIADDIHFLN